MASPTPIGISIPIQHGQNGFFDRTFDVDSNTQTALKIFFTTHRGERRFNPQFGTNLLSVLFEQIDPEDTDVLKDLVTTEIKNWFPQIVLKSIDIKKDETANIYGFEIKIKYYSNRFSSDLQTVSFQT